MEWLFLGYDDDFYDAIPWVEIDTEGMDPPFPNDGYDIDPSFIRIATKLKFRRDNEEVYAEYGLPEDEAVKAAVLASPELLFYAPELARLSGMLRDDGLILKLIESDQIIPYKIRHREIMQLLLYRLLHFHIPLVIEPE